MKPAKIVVSLSGGLDSAVMLALLSKQFPGDYDIACFSFDYGSRHNFKEIGAATDLCEHYHVRHRILNLDVVDQYGRSSLTARSKEVPEGHYEEESMRQTVVPGRNLIFASVLAGIAESLGAEAVYLAVHAGDHHIYPDCRPEFINSLCTTVGFSSGGKTCVRAPFINITKEMIVKMGLGQNVPFEKTWTCYKGEELSCGRCGSCQERLEAFKLNNAEDPLEYVTRELLPKKGS